MTQSRTSCLKVIKAGIYLSACLILLSCSSGVSPLTPLAYDARILAFGDSLTFGTGVSKEQAYPAVLAGLIDREVYNQGIPGEISADGLKRLPTVLAEIRPDLVIICHGGNDVLRRLSVKQTEQNLRAMIALVRDFGAEVIVIAVPKFGLFPKAPDYYEVIASELEVPVEMEILSELESDNTKKSDQVHFNRVGYREMAEAIEQLLLNSGAL